MPKVKWDKDLALWILLFGGFGLLVGGLAASCGYLVVHERDLKRLSDESRDWPQVAATIVRSKVEGRHSGGRASTTSYAAGVEYRYAVGGRTFVGSRTSFDPPDSLSEAERLVERYHPGDTVEAWYRPQDPSLATLQTGNWDSEGWVMLAALGALLLGAFALALFVMALLPFMLAVRTTRLWARAPSSGRRTVR